MKTRVLQSLESALGEIGGKRTKSSYRFPKVDEPNYDNFILTEHFEVGDFTVEYVVSFPRSLEKHKHDTNYIVKDKNITTLYGCMMSQSIAVYKKVNNARVKNEKSRDSDIGVQAHFILNGNKILVGVTKFPLNEFVENNEFYSKQHKELMIEINHMNCEGFNSDVLSNAIVKYIGNMSKIDK